VSHTDFTKHFSHIGQPNWLSFYLAVLFGSRFLQDFAISISPS